MEPMTLAVVSDLHIGNKARAKDLCPYEESEAIEKTYRETFLEFINQQDIRADYLLIPGDVTDGAQPDEVKLASEVISEIAKALNVPLERIVFVPGNHDVDWKALKLKDATGFRHSQRYAPLRDDQWIFEQIMSRGQNHICEKPYFSLWKDGNLLVEGYNSSWDDDPKLALHRGSVNQKHLLILEKELSTISSSSSQVRILLVHHHPVQYSNPIPNDPDFSIMVNAENLLGLLQKYHFDLLIHGHKHNPRFKIYMVDSGFPIAILCSGSFSAVLDPRWSGLVNNQFHMVRIFGRDEESQCVYGEVESWTYVCGHGWRPSESHNGIEHKYPFGTYVLPENLKSTLHLFLKKEFENGQNVEWSAIVSRFPHFQHLPHNLLMGTLDNLASEMGFIRHGDSPGDIILLKLEDDHE
ncbi:MAG: metallophosphoesterase [Candidatus Latescibacteria bacterium]|nr:metallophosphoesterase [Candidatus Latescibacterota bacterium]